MPPVNDTHKLRLRELSTILFDLKHGYLGRFDSVWLNPSSHGEIVDELCRRGLVTTGGAPDPESGITIASIKLTAAGEELYQEVAAAMKYRWESVSSAVEEPA
jgi:hypothetical protein